MSRESRLRAGLPPAVGALALALGLGLAGCGGDSDEPPAPGSAEELSLGQEVFAKNCATCHGEELRGGLAGPPLVHEIYAPDHHPDSAIRAAIANGVQPHHWDFAGMPPISGLEAHEVEAVVAFVRDTQREVWGGDTP